MRESDEQCRQKVVILREGLRAASKRNGIALSGGASNKDLLSSVQRLISTSEGVEYVERLNAGWHEEYRQLVQCIGRATHHEFDVEANPHEVISSITKQRGA